MSDDEPTPEELEDESQRARRAALLHVPAPMNDAPAWVLTFADLFSQLNGLFILLLTFAHFVPAEFRQLKGSVETVFGSAVANSGQVDAPPPTPDIPAAERAAPRETGLLDGLRRIVARHQGRLQGGNVEIEVFEDYRGVTLRLGQVALFDPEESAVRPGAWVFLDAVGALLESEPARLDVEVRVPRSPVDSTAGPDGAVDRAGFAGTRGTRIVRYLLGRDPGLDPSRLGIRAVGVPEDLGPLSTPKGRLAGDRVDFVFSRAAAQAEPPP